ncbi:hypothetical protein OE88DRAFT_1664096 [Heliocybe sulcata]|uniref:Zn(2)-C6 fungal-type domain-containing protein n=1 Tax=Heliocybe sulcata TaxID=5364 RepID=A0A5C3MVZ5_9AGAM|nr:hypothetical protein OE88DRAFT_1664096 [Heliocybe sulcata]
MPDTSGSSSESQKGWLAAAKRPDKLPDYFDNRIEPSAIYVLPYNPDTGEPGEFFVTAGRCDHCKHLKQLCSRGKPCSRCKGPGHTCTYSDERPWPLAGYYNSGGKNSLRTWRVRDVGTEQIEARMSQQHHSSKRTVRSKYSSPTPSTGSSATGFKDDVLPAKRARRSRFDSLYPSDEDIVQDGETLATRARPSKFNLSPSSLKDGDIPLGDDRRVRRSKPKPNLMPATRKAKRTGKRGNDVVPSTGFEAPAAIPKAKRTSKRKIDVAGLTEFTSTTDGPSHALPNKKRKSDHVPEVNKEKTDGRRGKRVPPTWSVVVPPTECPKFSFTFPTTTPRIWSSSPAELLEVFPSLSNATNDIWWDETACPSRPVILLRGRAWEGDGCLDGKQWRISFVRDHYRAPPVPSATIISEPPPATPEAHPPYEQPTAPSCPPLTIRIPPRSPCVDEEPKLQPPSPAEPLASRIPFSTPELKVGDASGQPVVSQNAEDIIQGDLLAGTPSHPVPDNQFIPVEDLPTCPSDMVSPPARSSDIVHHTLDHTRVDDQGSLPHASDLANGDEDTTLVEPGSRVGLPTPPGTPSSKSKIAARSPQHLTTGAETVQGILHPTPSATPRLEDRHTPSHSSSTPVIAGLPDNLITMPANELSEPVQLDEAPLPDIPAVTAVDCPDEIQALIRAQEEGVAAVLFAGEDWLGLGKEESQCGVALLGYFHVLGCDRKAVTTLERERRPNVERIRWTFTFDWASEGDSILFLTESEGVAVPAPYSAPWWNASLSTAVSDDSPPIQEEKMHDTYDCSLLQDMLRSSLGYGAADEPPLPGWHCTACGKLNVTKWLRHRVCDNCPKPPAATVQGYAASLSSVRSTRAPGNYRLLDRSLRHSAAFVPDGPSIYSIFFPLQLSSEVGVATYVRNGRREAAVPGLFERVQVEAKFGKWPEGNGRSMWTKMGFHSAWRCLAGRGHAVSEDEEVTPWHEVPESVATLKELMLDVCKICGELDARIGRLSVVLWMGNGKRKVPIPKTQGPTVIMCLGNDLLIDVFAPDMKHNTTTSVSNVWSTSVAADLDSTGANEAGPSLARESAEEPGGTLPGDVDDEAMNLEVSSTADYDLAGATESASLPHEIRSQPTEDVMMDAAPPASGVDTPSATVQSLAFEASVAQEPPQAESLDVENSGPAINDEDACPIDMIPDAGITAIQLTSAVDEPSETAPALPIQASVTQDNPSMQAFELTQMEIVAEETEMRLIEANEASSLESHPTTVPAEIVAPAKKSATRKDPPLYVTVAHGDALILSGSDFELTVERKGMTMMVVGAYVPDD